RGGHGGRVLRNRTGRRDGLSRLLAVIGVALVLAPAAAAKVFVIEGRGWGHGLGMSQWGAEGFAEHGVGYRAILAHYYPGTQLARMAGSSVRVPLADGRAQFVVASRAPFRVVADGHRRVLRPGRYAVPSRRLRPRSASTRARDRSRSTAAPIGGRSRSRVGPARSRR